MSNTIYLNQLNAGVTTTQLYDDILKTLNTPFVTSCCNEYPDFCNYASIEFIYYIVNSDNLDTFLDAYDRFYYNQITVNRLTHTGALFYLKIIDTFNTADVEQFKLDLYRIILKSKDLNTIMALIDLNVATDETLVTLSVIENDVKLFNTVVMLTGMLLTAPSQYESNNLIDGVIIQHEKHADKVAVARIIKRTHKFIKKRFSNIGWTRMPNIVRYCIELGIIDIYKIEYVKLRPALNDMAFMDGFKDIAPPGNYSSINVDVLKYLKTNGYDINYGAVFTYYIENLNDVESLIHWAIINAPVTATRLYIDGILQRQAKTPNDTAAINAVDQIYGRYMFIQHKIACSIMFNDFARKWFLERSVIIAPSAIVDSITLWTEESLRHVDEYNLSHSNKIQYLKWLSSDNESIADNALIYLIGASVDGRSIAVKYSIKYGRLNALHTAISCGYVLSDDEMTEISESKYYFMRRFLNETLLHI